MLNLKAEELTRAEQLMREGKYDEAIQIVNKLEDLKNLTLQDQFEIHHLKSSLLFEIGRFDDALQYIELASKESQQIGNLIDIFDVLLYKIKILWRSDKDYEVLDALKDLQVAEDLLNSINSLSSKELKKKKAYVMMRKSSIYFEIGDLNCSKKYVDGCLTLAKELNNKRLIMLIKKRLTLISNIKGEIDQALEYGKQYLILANEIEDKQEIIGALNAIGFAYNQKGNFDQALNHLKQSLSLCEEINSWKTGTILMSLFDNYINMNDLEKAQHCLNRMNQINKNKYDKWLDDCYRVGKAIVLKKKSGDINHLKAKEILKQIVNEEGVFAQLYYIALIHLCDLYLKELSKSDDLKILDEIQPYLNRLKDIANSQHSWWLIVELYLFQAKLKLISFEFNKTQKSQSQALDIAEKYGQTLLAERVRMEQDELLNKKIKWEKLRKSEALMAERIELSHLDNQIGRMLRKRSLLK